MQVNLKVILKVDIKKQRVPDLMSLVTFPTENSNHDVSFPKSTTGRRPIPWLKSRRFPLPKKTVLYWNERLHFERKIKSLGLKSNILNVRRRNTYPRNIEEALMRFFSAKKKLVSSNHVWSLGEDPVLI